MLEDYEDVLEACDVCDILHMSRNSLYLLLKSEELKAFQVGRIWKIPKLSVIEYIKTKSSLL